VRAVPRLCELYPGVSLTNEGGGKRGKSSVRVVARTSQAGTVHYKKNEQCITQKKNCNTVRYNVTEQYRTQNTQQRKQSILGK
jgi:hypothetical protein